MNSYKMSGTVLIIFLMSFILLIGCRKQVELQSEWLDREIMIDGNDIDWKDYPFFCDEKTYSCIGLYNNEKNLYLCFQTMNKDIQKQILRNGLNIWFNETGGKDKELGLIFPQGGGPGGSGGPPPEMSRGMYDLSPDMPSGMSGFPKGRPDDPNMPPGRTFHEGFTHDARVIIKSSEDDKGYNCSVERAAKLGIEVKYNIDEQNRFIYELKMPIVETDSTAFVVKVPASNQIGMGFMTAKIEMKKGHGDMGGPGGGMGGPPRGGGMGSKAGSLEIWANVTLASEPVIIQ